LSNRGGLEGGKMKTIVNRVLCAAMLPALLLAGCSRRDEASVGTPANPLLVLLSPAHAPAAPAALVYIQEVGTPAC